VDKVSAPSWFHRDIFSGDYGSDVIACQRLLGAMKTGVMDEDTTARVRGLQRAVQREITGVVDHALAVLMGEVSTFGLLPEWFTAGDLEKLYVRLHTDAAGIETALRRFQSHHHITPTGVLDEATAIAIGD
jgi:hypothetical protein